MCTGPSSTDCCNVFDQAGLCRIACPVANQVAAAAENYICSESILYTIMQAKCIIKSMTQAYNYYISISSRCACIETVIFTYMMLCCS